MIWRKLDLPLWAFRGLRVFFGLSTWLVITGALVSESGARPVFEKIETPDSFALTLRSPVLSAPILRAKAKNNSAAVLACFQSKAALTTPQAATYNLPSAYNLALLSLWAYADENFADLAPLKLNFPEVHYLKATRQQIFDAPGADLRVLIADSQALWLENDHEIVLAFRGTDPSIMQNLISDFLIRDVDFGNLGQVHSGFYAALKILWPQIEARLKAPRSHAKPIYLTGHSLGAGMATLMAAKLLKTQSDFTDQMNDFDFSGFWTRPFLAGLYTFGSPKVGDTQFALLLNMLFRKAQGSQLRSADAQYFSPATHSARFVLARDMVTQLPLLSSSYTHIDDLKYLDGAGNIFTDRDALSHMNEFLSVRLHDHEMDEYLEALFEVQNHGPSGCL